MVGFLLDRPFVPTNLSNRASATELDDFEAEIEDELEALNKHEREIIAYLLDRNERLFTCAVDGGHAVTLFSRKLLNGPSPRGSKYTQRTCLSKSRNLFGKYFRNIKLIFLAAPS